MSGNNDSKDKKNFEEMTDEEKTKKYQNDIKSLYEALREATEIGERAQLIDSIKVAKTVLAYHLASCRSYGEN